MKVSAEDERDAALIAWLEHEESLFRRLERRVVSARIEADFTNEHGVDVDGFIRLSFSVQNRCKSRMWHSLENHLAAVLRAHNIRHVRGAVAEHNHKHDFLFLYLNTCLAAPADGDPRLTMLRSKSTCKDRWRQVLAEVKKISHKHLLTLESGISEPQTGSLWYPHRFTTVTPIRGVVGCGVCRTLLLRSLESRLSSIHQLLGKSLNLIRIVESNQVGLLLDEISRKFNLIWTRSILQALWELTLSNIEDKFI